MGNLREFSAKGYRAPHRRGAAASLTKTQFPASILGTSPASEDLLNFASDRRFGTILADPPWQFQNRTGKIAPEHKRLSRYGTMTLDDIKALPMAEIAEETSHLYLWVPNAMLPDGLTVLRAWGFQYKSNLVWHKIRKDGGSDGRGAAFTSGT